jgi:hypothetical protein
MACSCTIGHGTKLTLLTACTLSTCTQWLQRRACTKPTRHLDLAVDLKMPPCRAFAADKEL